MSKRAAPRSRPAAEPQASAPDFTPAASTRATGWTPARQTTFIEALSQSGCVHEACRAVGLSRQSAYALRMRTDAQGFRLAWDAAIDLAMRRLSDECLSRALNGEAQPIFFQGEQIGERRRYDNKLAMFLLRYRDPLRYAASNDQMVYRGHPEKAALDFARARERMQAEANGVSDTRADVAGAGEPWVRVELTQAYAEKNERDDIEGTHDIGGSYERRRRIAQARIDHRNKLDTAERAAAVARGEPPRTEREAEAARAWAALETAIGSARADKAAKEGGRGVKTVNGSPPADPPPPPKPPRAPPAPRVL